MMWARWTRLLAAAVFLAAVVPAAAQPAGDSPHIGYVFPAGGCRGTTFQIVVGGQNIKPVNLAYISGGGVTAKIVRWYRPMTAGEANSINMKINDTREELEKTRGKGVTREMAIQAAGITEEQLKELAIYQKRQGDTKRQPNPQIDEQLIIQVELASDAAVGDREIRLLTANGMSNPLWFYVGQWPEVTEKEPNDLVPDTYIRQTLPMVINGQIMPGDVDRFSLDAKKGMKLVAHCSARELIPYLADAVPGWFQAVLHLYDDKGKEVAFADSLGFRHDPVLYYEVPRDGKYVLEIHDSIYRGREDFVYRISVGEIPYVTGLFPLGGKVGRPTTIEVLGWNLPVESLRMEPSTYRGRLLRPVVVEKDNIFSNRVGFLVDTLQEVLEKEPNDTPETAQEVGSPVIINGRIDRPGDVDYFHFPEMSIVVAEVYARRLYSPLDSIVRLTDSHGKVVAFNDDYEDKAWPLITHHADSRLLATTKGARYISIGDAQGRGGHDFAYRLYIRPPRPDFELRVTPASLTARPGAWNPITVHAFRKDGFDDDIALELDNAPKGFALSGAWIPSGQDKSRLTVYVPPQAAKEPLLLQMNGLATLHRQRVVRPAVPAEAMTQAFILQHLLPTKDWTVFVAGGGGGNLPVRLAEPGLRLVEGDTTKALFLVDEGQDASQFRFELSEPPKGISLKDAERVGMGRGLALPIKLEPEKVKAGLKGNLLITLAQESSSLSKADKKITKNRWTIGMMPAIPFEVVAGKKGRGR